MKCKNCGQELREDLRGHKNVNLTKVWNIVRDCPKAEPEKHKKTFGLSLDEEVTTWS